jgi:hypothetical protein
MIKANTLCSRGLRSQGTKSLTCGQEEIMRIKDRISTGAVIGVATRRHAEDRLHADTRRAEQSDRNGPMEGAQRHRRRSKALRDQVG